MNSKELNLAKKIKKIMFSFQGIMVFYKMPAAILFINIAFFNFKIGFVFAILKKGNNSIFQFQEK